MNLYLFRMLCKISTTMYFTFCDDTSDLDNGSFLAEDTLVHINRNILKAQMTAQFLQLIIKAGSHFLMWFWHNC